MYKVILWDRNRLHSYLLHMESSNASLMPSASLTLDTNKADLFNFALDQGTEAYIYSTLGALIDIYDDAICIFSGQITAINTDIYMRKSITCEGFFGALSDVVIRPGTLGPTVQSAVATLLNTYNANVPDHLAINIGIMTNGGADAYTAEANYETATKYLKDIVDLYGGYMRVRYDANDGKYYLDYLRSFQPSTQKAVAGQNILSLNIQQTNADVYQYIIPISKPGGLTIASITGSDRLTVPFVTNGKEKKITIDASTAQELYDKAQIMLLEMVTENRYINANIFDLHQVDAQQIRFTMLNSVRVISSAHNIDDDFTITKMQIDINNPSQNKITLGKDTTRTISQRV